MKSKKFNIKTKTLENIFVLVIFMISLIIVYVNPFYNESYKNKNYIIKDGIVVNTYDNLDYNGIVKIGFQEVYVKVDNKIIKFSNVLRGNWILDNYFEKGDKVKIIYYKNTPMYLCYDRVSPLVLYALLFLGLILIIGGFNNGSKVIVSLLFTIVVVFYIILPLLMENHSFTYTLLLLGVIISLIIFTCFLVICGFTKKAVASSISTLLGVFTSGILGYIGMIWMKIPSVGVSEFAQMLLFSGHPLNFHPIIIASIILASLGAIMDVAIDISSGLYEIKRHKENISFKGMFKSGINIGRDIMGTMANTLILVYVGSLIIPIMYFVIKGTPIYIMLSYNFIAFEILTSLCGSIGIIVSIVFSAFISSYLYVHKK